MVDLPKELCVEGVDMRVKFSSQSSDRKVIFLHFRCDFKVGISINLNVSEVTRRTTTRSKEIVVGPYGCTSMFFCAQVVHVTWSCMFIIGRWEVKICTLFSNWGDTHCASETCETYWCTIRRARSGLWCKNTETAEVRAPPDQVPGDTAKERTRQTTTWSRASKHS